MSMRVVPFKTEHFLAIEWQGPQKQGQELYREEWAEEVAEGSDAWTGIDEDGYIIACAGVWPTRIMRIANGPDICLESLAWAIFSPRLSQHAKAVFREIRNFLNDRPERRIEAWVDANHDKAAPFLERLGFTFEREDDTTHPQAQKLRLYARVRH